MRGQTVAAPVFAALVYLASPGAAFGEGGESGDAGATQVDVTTRQWVDATQRDNLAAVVVGGILFDSAEDLRVRELGRTLVSERAELAARLQNVAASQSVRVDAALVSAVGSVSKLAPAPPGTAVSDAAPAEEPDEAHRVYEREPPIRDPVTGSADADDPAAHTVSVVTDEAIAGVQVARLASRLDGAARREVRTLRQARTSPDFDRRALDAVIAQGEHDLDALRLASRTLDNEGLADWAQRAMPVIQKHLDTARNLARELKP